MLCRWKATSTSSCSSSRGETSAIASVSVSVSSGYTKHALLTSAEIEVQLADAHVVEGLHLHIMRANYSRM